MLCWYFVSQLKKMKSSGEIIYCGQVFKKSSCRWRTSASGCITTLTERPRVPGVPGPDHHRHCHSMLSWHRWPAQHLGPLNPDHDGEANHSQQVPPANRQAVPQLQDQVSAAPLSPTSPASIMLHQQEAQHLLLDTGPSPSLGQPK